MVSDIAKERRGIYYKGEFSTIHRLKVRLRSNLCGKALRSLFVVHEDVIIHMRGREETT